MNLYVSLCSQTAPEIHFCKHLKWKKLWFLQKDHFSSAFSFLLAAAKWQFHSSTANYQNFLIAKIKLQFLDSLFGLTVFMPNDG